MAAAKVVASMMTLGAEKVAETKVVTARAAAEKVASVKVAAAKLVAEKQVERQWRPQQWQWLAIVAVTAVTAADRSTVFYNK